MLISVDAISKWFGSVEKQPEPGENVVLTIDEKIQYIAERELEAAMQQTHADQRHGDSGESAHRRNSGPGQSADFQSESIRAKSRPRKLKNHAVSDVYEPGSTFKLVTISAALEEKLTRPDEVFDCQMGSIVCQWHANSRLAARME